MSADKQQVSQLLEPLPNGLPRVSEYSEFRRITSRQHSDETFILWARTAVTLMKQPEGSA